MCDCVGVVIPGFPCFGKYLFVKGIEVRQTEEKKGLCPEMETMFLGEEKRL